MIEWVFFDLDDTLLDHQTAAKQAAAHLYEQYVAGTTVSREQFINHWRHVSETYFDKYLAGELHWQSHGRLRIQAAFDLTHERLANSEADARFATYVGAYEASWVLFPDALPCLHSLRDRKLGVISNGTGWQQRAKIERVGLADFFHVTVISESAGAAKPDPRIFAHACREAAADPARCLYVGDRLATDALAAHAAGLQGVWLNREGKAAHSAPSHITVIDTLNALPSVVAAIA